jgi:hypothetical protein
MSCKRTKGHVKKRGPLFFLVRKDRIELTIWGFSVIYSCLMGIIKPNRPEVSTVEKRQIAQVQYSLH